MSKITISENRICRKIIALLLGIVFILPNNVTIISAKGETKKEYVIIAKDKGAHKDLYKNYEIDSNLYTKSMSKMNISVGELTDEQVNEIEGSKGGYIVEENICVNGCGAVNIDPRDVSIDWNKKIINANNYEEETSLTEEPIKIAIIDSGIDETGDIIVKERCNLVPGEENTPIYFEDNTGHGTAIASVIGSVEDQDTNISGICTNAEIYSIKVMDSDNTAPISRIVEAIYRAMEYDVDIINMSFGTAYDSEILYKAIRDAYESGILMIAAAGNNGELDGYVEYPAAYDEVISVGAIDANADITHESSRGENVDIYAPGLLVRTLTDFGLETATSGTSIATPHITAIAAILWGKDNSKSNDFIRNLMIYSANRKKEESEEYAIADLEYALEIYEEYEINYANNNYVIPQNTNKIITDHSTAKVQARWGKNKHADMAVAAITASGKTLTNVQKALIKAGAKYNDIDGENVNIYGARDVKILHSLTKESNYIAATFYLGKIIQATGCKPSNVSSTLELDITATQKAEINGIINNINWETITGLYDVLDGVSKTPARTRFVVFGMSLHVITDAFAHRSYGLIGDTWQHVPGSNDMTDDPEVIPNRYNAAGQVVKNAIADCLDVDTPGESKTIRCKQIMNNDYFDGTFKLADLYFFALRNRNNDATFESYIVKLAENTDSRLSDYLNITDNESRIEQGLALQREYELQEIIEMYQ